MRIHVGHHFYGAGNVGDDFMLAGFLAAIRRMKRDATVSCCSPFSLEPMRRLFPAVDWRPYTPDQRADAVQRCDVWLGLGGSPFQSAQSRWFINHLLEEADLCRRLGKPMFFLGVGVQRDDELAAPGVLHVIRQAEYIWTRDDASAAWLANTVGSSTVTSGRDLAHVLFASTTPSAPTSGTVALVPNFDYTAWETQGAWLAAIDQLRPTQRWWVAQESRPLPGAEKALHAALPPATQSEWQLRCPSPDLGIEATVRTWPVAEHLITARYHSALLGAWAGSRIVVIAINEKLKAAARELGAPSLPVGASESEISTALESARPVASATLTMTAAQATRACDEFVRAIGRFAST